MRFILGAKRADHEALFEWVEASGIPPHFLYQITFVTY